MKTVAVFILGFIGGGGLCAMIGTFFHYSGIDALAEPAFTVLPLVAIGGGMIAVREWHAKRDGVGVQIEAASDTKDPEENAALMKRANEDFQRAIRKR